jgi:alpha-tubulin suppressor-like RCC1 family protein
VRVAGLADAVELASSGARTCARTRAGEVWCWGLSWRIDAPADVTPVQVPNLTGAVDLELGSTFGCVRHDDGDVACWGSNDLGGLGDGGRLDHSDDAVPVARAAGSTRLVIGGGLACARVDRAWRCWGYAEDSSIYRQPVEPPWTTLRP